MDTLSLVSTIAARWSAGTATTLTVLLAGALVFATPRVAMANMGDLWAAINGLETMLRGEHDFDRRELGNAIHGYHVKIWENMARVEGSAIRRLPNNRTFTGKSGVHVFGIGEVSSRPYIDPVDNELKHGPGPRIEVWIEKWVGENNEFRADRVIIDHEARTVTVSDITTRDMDDPTLVRRSGAQRHAIEHNATNILRTGAIRDHMDSLGIPGYTVEAHTDPGGHYETAVRRIMADQDAEEERARRRLSAIDTDADGGGGSRAARATVGAIFVGMGISMMFPDQAAAQAAAQSRAERQFRDIIQRYVRGDIEGAERIRRSSEWQDFNRPQVANTFFPLIEGTLAYGAFLRFISPWLDGLRESARGVAEQRRVCQVAFAEYRRRVREAEAAIEEAGERVRRQVDRAYRDVIRRLTERNRRLTAIARDTSLATWDAEARQAVQQQVGEAGDSLLTRLRERQTTVARQLEGRPATEILPLMPGIQRDVAGSLYAYWQYMAATLPAFQAHVAAKQKAAKQPLIDAYLGDAEGLAPGGAGWQALRDRFAVREGPVDRPFVQEINGHYGTFAQETRALAAAVKELEPQNTRAVADMTSLAPESAIGRLEPQLALSLSIITYQNVAPTQRHYTEAVTVLARPILERILKVRIVEQGAVALFGAWLNSLQTTLATLESELREGMKLLLWAEVVDQAARREHEWPVGPPPAGGLRSRAIQWTLAGASPATGTGHVFRTTLPIIGAEAAPRTLILRAVRPGSATLERPLIVHPNKGPSMCLTLPESAPRTSPVRIAWTVSDPDPRDRLELTIDFAGGRVGSLDSRNGNPQVADFQPGQLTEIKISGERALDGRAIVVWPPQPREYTIIATVSDGLNELKQEYKIRIDPSSPPRMISMAIPGHDDGSRYEVGDLIPVSYEAMDEDPDERLEFILRLPDGLERVMFFDCEGDPASGRRCQALVRGLREGRYTVRVDVLDRSLQRDTDTIEVVVGSPAANCGRIDCDCHNLDFGLLTGPFREECRNHEAGLKQQCEATGRIEGSCHPTASGPNPWPR